MIKTIFAPLIKLIKIYYRYLSKYKVSKGYWTCYSGISGIFMHDSGLKQLVTNIKNGYFTNILFTLNEKNNLLRDIFSDLIEKTYNNHFNQQMLEDFCLECTDLVVRSARSNSAILKDIRIRRIIINYSFMSYYRAELCQLWQISADTIDHENEQLKLAVGLGSKNSAPYDLVKEMYDLQAKGCPVPPNKNNPAG
jgi:hypothetical protein